MVLSFIIICLIVNSQCQRILQTTSTSTNTNSQCLSIQNPSIINDCLSLSTSDNVCCFNKNSVNGQSNACNLVPSSSAAIYNGTTYSQNSTSYLQICLNSANTTVASTCGISNPTSYSDCQKSNSNLGNSYFCCFSQITVSGQTKSGCVVREKVQNMITSYQSEGLYYTCKSNTIKAMFVLLGMVIFLFN